MITNSKSTTVAQELAIMAMPDIEPMSYNDMEMQEYERELEDRNVRDYEERLRMEAMGLILNPYYDEDDAYRTWKYDLEVKFRHICYVTPEQLADYERYCDAVRLGWELYFRLLDDDEAKDDYEIAKARWAVREYDVDEEKDRRRMMA